MNIKIFHPIKTIKEWRLKRAEVLKEEQYNNGYNFAAGTMLRGEESPFSLTAKYKNSPWYYYRRNLKCHNGWNYFYYGVEDAIDYFIDNKLIKDDRV